ncbi:MAG: NifU family protein [Actinomycetota bacterium]|jgi:Fe-S cluster biogenesis protein NfuA|nr:NifU family protein [Actinomycetota bacterium]PLS75054.1 MAG: NifU family protein [Actinomycetota bacterium]
MQAALREAVEAIRPALQVDGGDMNVLRLDEETGVVDIELVGACDGCPMSSMTLKAGIERILKDRVPGLTEVRAKGIDFDTLDDGFAAGTATDVGPLPEGSSSFS